MASDLVGEIRAALDAIDTDLQEEYEIRGDTTIDVADTNITIEAKLAKSFYDYADETVSGKLGEIGDLLTKLEEEGPNLGEIDSGKLAKALAVRIERECREQIRPSTAFTYWGSPYKNVLEALLEPSVSSSPETAAKVSRLVKAGQQVLLDIKNEEDRAKVAEQARQEMAEQLEMARRETASAREELEQERSRADQAEFNLAAEKEVAAAARAEVETRIEAARNEPRPRIPWSFARGDTPSAKDYPDVFEPPRGYDWTGEFRRPGRFEPFLQTNGQVSAGMERPQKLNRVILRRLGVGEKPSWPPTAGSPGDTRLEWDKSRTTILSKNLPTKMKPPPGYDWTGEIRPVKQGDYWLQSSRVPTGPALRDRTITRVILRKLQEGEQPTFGLNQDPGAANGRKPWPGTQAARDLGAGTKQFAERYDPPTGYEWVEFRSYKAGDLFLSKSGRVEFIGTSYTGSSADMRHILRATTASPKPQPRESSYVVGPVAAAAAA